jgi:acyl transferase domain-containing protein/acyl carrier protein
MDDDRDSVEFDGIAIIGMAGRFPGARDVEAFWQNLRAGVESIVGLSEDEMLAAGVSPDELADPDYVRAGAPIDDVELFDAAFFGYSPREAESIDPQQRFFLESAWTALERAGYDPAAYAGAIGVFAGCGTSSYLPLLQMDPVLMGALGRDQLVLGNDKDSLTTRVSYKLNLRGPSVTVQTACSTSLVAVCVACQSLLAHECDMALAGGATIVLPQRTGYWHEEGGIMAPDGHCRAFDAAARGTVGGNGVGVVVLKRLADALADGDHVHAVLRGFALNNDGALKVGFTAPSVQGQAEVIGMALALAGVEPDDISYVETHGTGTPLGDPIEIAALTRVFRAKTARRQFCAIGSLKSNVGHLVAAAGVASLIKTVMALEHRELPPSLHFERPNPKLDLENSPFYVNTRLTPWSSPRGPLRAGVSSFGFGGTNAHVIVEEAPPRPSSGPSRRLQLLTLSARSEAALARVADDMREHLARHPDAPIADVAYTCHVGRRAWPLRRAVVGDGAAAVCEALASEISPRSIPCRQEASERPIVFLFPGQGSQHVFMARELYEAEPVFRRSLDRSAELVRDAMGVDLREHLYPAPEQRAAAKQAIEQTVLAQPALFAVELALARLWMAWGIRPQVMLGHSVGEFVAACLADVFDEEDAIRLVAERGRWMQQMPPGAMLAVSLGELELAPYLDGEVSLAALNGPALSVVAGPIAAIDALETELSGRRIACRRLHTSHAFHTGMMAPVVDVFTRRVSEVARRPPKIPFHSSLTGARVTAEDAVDPVYWARQIAEPVRFADGVRQLLSQGDRIWLEVGPGQTLTQLVRQQAHRVEGQTIVASLPHAREAVSRASQPAPRPLTEAGSDHLALLTALGRMWVAGATIDWQGFHAGETRRRVPLPTYPFERQRFWPSVPRRGSPAAAPAEPLLAKNPDISEWFFVPSWRRSDLLASLAAASSPTQPSTWLIFVGDEGLGEALEETVARRGHTVVCVRAGEGFERTGERRYTIDPGTRADYATLFARLESEGHSPDRIVHALCALPEIHGRRDHRAALEVERRIAFDSLLFVAQSLLEQRSVKPLTLGVVTTQAHSVTGAEVIEPLRALVLGPCRVIPQEHPHIACRNIDVELPAGDGRAELAAWLVAELERESSDPVVAYRGGRRWIESVERSEVGRSTAGAAPRLRERGTYLVTGGLGGIGSVAAEILAREARARLILVGRTALPERDRWNEWLAAHGADPTSRKLRRVLALEQAGAEVMLAAADVSDVEAMRRVVEQGRARFGRIDGVIHSAGVAGGGMIELKTPEAAWQVLVPKVGGTLVLDALFRDDPPDLFLLCSSLASLVGGASQIDYCSANAFLDAYAQSRGNDEACRVIAVDWDTWSDIGMAVDIELPPDLDEVRRESLKRAISASEGADLLRRILSAKVSGSLAICTSDLCAYLHQLTAVSEPRLEDAPAPRPTHPRPAIGRAFVAPETELERQLAAIWRDVLGIEEVGVHDDFLELGGHSLMATQVLSRIIQSFRTKVPLARFLEAPTVAGLARLIESTRAEGSEPGQPELTRIPRDRYRTE